MPVFDVEEFVSVVGLPGYVINIEGVLKRIPYIKVRPTKNSSCSYTTKIRTIKWRTNEYLDAEVHVGSKRRTVKQHRLLAQTFLVNPDNLPQINHINGDKHDNRLENLEWVSAQQNVIHSYKTGLASNSRERHPKTKFTQDDIDWIREMRKRGVSLKELAEIFSVTVSGISKITTKVNWG